MKRSSSLCLSFLLLTAAAACARPVVIAHRGASGYLPEHTLQAYKLAIEQGADFIEPDLVPTRDGVLIARHENQLADTTDVSAHPEFADRRVKKTIDGVESDGWFSEDFTLEELRTLRCRGRSALSRRYDDRFQVVTLAEVLDLAQQAGRPVGVYPETKHPSYFRRIGHPLEEALVAQLEARGWRSKGDPVVIQSFETDSLRRLHALTGLRLAQLVDAEGAPQDWVEKGDARRSSDMLTPQGLAEVATYADILAPAKELLLTESGSATELLVRAHAAGLKVHAWTFRAENRFLPPAFRLPGDDEALGNLSGDAARYFSAGLDGVFCNHPDQAVSAAKGFPDP